MSQPFPAACLYLTGPTASGKTAVGIELAKLVGAEIVSMDSMSLYRGMDVGTAKPTRAERNAVPHHLVDLLDPHEKFSQAEYAAAARRVVDDIVARGKTPLFVGGTPLYLKTLLRGMFVGPAADWEFRRLLQTHAEYEGSNFLHAELKKVDPAAAAKLHPNDERRLIRALEVWSATGKPISEHQRQFQAVRADAIGRVFVLDWPRHELPCRIEARVDRMVVDGLFDEVRRLAAAPEPLSRTARQALGYREVLDYLTRPAPSLAHWEATVDAIKTHTRQFAKRQRTWLRSLPECRWIAMSGDPDPRDVAQAVLAEMRRT